MTDALRFTKQMLQSGNYKVTCRVESDSFPESIFLYKLTTDGNLGDFYGVVDRHQLSNRRVWTSPITSPSFGSSFVRYVEMEEVYPTEELANKSIERITLQAAMLKKELESAMQEEVILVPLAEGA